MSRKDLEARVAALEAVISSSQGEIAAQIELLQKQHQSACRSQETQKMRVDSIWLLAKGMHEPWAGFIFSIIANSLPSIQHPDLFELKAGTAYPGWAWRDGRAVFPSPSREASPSTPQAEERVKEINALRQAIADMEKRIARLVWEENLRLYEHKSEQEIAELSQIIWGEE